MFIYVLAICVGPGPTNIISAALAKKHGFANTLGFVSGSALGYVILAILLGFGRFYLLEEYEFFLNVVTYCGSVFFIYFAISMLVSKKIKMGLKEGFILQMFNPYSWYPVLEGSSKFVKSYDTLSVFILMILAVAWISQVLWAYFGGAIANLKQQITVNGLIAVLLVGHATYFIISTSLTFVQTTFRP